MLQYRFVVKLQKYFVDYETFNDFPSADNDWIYIYGWSQQS